MIAVVWMTPALRDVVNLLWLKLELLLGSSGSYPLMTTAVRDLRAGRCCCPPGVHLGAVDDPRGG